MLREKRYDDIAEMYDIVELGGDGKTALTNALIIQHLKNHRAHRVLDMACGTGAQAIALHEAGFEVVASDLNESMLKVARKKARDLGIAFHKADMTDASLGKFDAIIAISNAVGHLTPEKFEQALRNALNHLNDGGVLIFDVFNAPLMDYMPRKPIIDVALSNGNSKYVRYSAFEYEQPTGVLTVNQTTHIQEDSHPYVSVEESYQLQTYSASSLKGLILASGFSDAVVSGEGMQELFGDTGMVNFALCRK